MMKEVKMSDYDDLPDLTKILTVELNNNLDKLFNQVHEVVQAELMKFTAEQLEILYEHYGKAFKYPMWVELKDLLEGPTHSSAIH